MYSTVYNVGERIQQQTHETNLGANVQPREVLSDPLLPHGKLRERSIELRAICVLLLAGHHANHKGPENGRRTGEDNPVEAGDAEAANVKRQPAVRAHVLKHIGLDGVIHDGLCMFRLGVYRYNRKVHMGGHRDRVRCQ